MCAKQYKKPIKKRGNPIFYFNKFIKYIFISRKTCMFLFFLFQNKKLKYFFINK